MIYKDNTITNQPMFHFNYGQPHLSLENHRQAIPQDPQIIPKCSTNILLLFYPNKKAQITKFTISHLHYSGN